MVAGVYKLYIQQGETFSKDILLTNIKKVRCGNVSAQSLQYSSSVIITTGGLGAIATGDYISFSTDNYTNKYKVTTGIADLSLGGTITLASQLLDMIDTGISVQVYSVFDLTGYTARAQLRPTADSSTLTATFTCSISSPTNGIITISLTDTQTSAIPTTGKKYYNSYGSFTWDLEIVSGGVVSRILNDSVDVSPEVTK